MNNKYTRTDSRTSFWTPRFWPTWLGFGVIWTAAQLPYGMQIRIGRLIGRLAYRLSRERRRVCETNIALCFPEFDEGAQRDLVRETFLSNGIGIMEIGLAWCRKPADFRDRVSISGLENLQQASEQGRGVLLLCAHFSTLEFAGSLLTLFHEMDVTYRRHKNPLFEALMTRSRQRLYDAVIERKNVRGALRRLKQGRTVWYAPDQDYGPKHSVYVDFFGRKAATITATSRFAAFNRSPVVFFSHYRKRDNSGYHLNFSPPLRDYPGGDEAEDARRVNAVIEEAVRKHPEQYIWLHKRFKTQPGGKATNPYNN